jgi:hypothetical protein
MIAPDLPTVTDFVIIGRSLVIDRINMPNRERSLLLLIIYLLAGIFLIPIIWYLLVFVWTTNPDAQDYFVAARVFLSAPMLIFLGTLLILVFQGRVHRLFGAILLFIGILWILALLAALMEKAVII